jgi:hypothetical protein
MNVPLLNILGVVMLIVAVIWFIKLINGILTAPDTFAEDSFKAGEERYRRGARSALFG